MAAEQPTNPASYIPFDTAGAIYLVDTQAAIPAAALIVEDNVATQEPIAKIQYVDAAMSSDGQTLYVLGNGGAAHCDSGCASIAKVTALTGAKTLTPGATVDTGGLYRHPTVLAPI